MQVATGTLRVASTTLAGTETTRQLVGKSLELAKNI